MALMRSENSQIIVMIDAFNSMTIQLSDHVTDMSVSSFYNERFPSAQS